MPVTNSKHSFVDFEGRLDDEIVLDAYKAELAFQFLFSADMQVPREDQVKIKVGSADETTVHFILAQAVQDICYWGVISGIDFDADFPLVVGEDQIIPAAEYADIAALLAALTAVGFNATDTTFLQCCSENLQDYEIAGTTLGDPRTISINFYRGLCYIDNTGSPQDGKFTSHGITSEVCYKLVITHPALTQNFWSNTFRRVLDTDYPLAFLTYYNNEDSYEFYYPKILANKLWIAFKLEKPIYTEERKVYRKSNRLYKTLSASIEKQWECMTDFFPDDIHDRIVVALAHDNTFFKNDFLDEQVWKRPGEQYAIDWKEKYPKDKAQATAKFKIDVQFAGRNSNCEKKPVCVALPEPAECVPVEILESVDLPNAVVGEEYNYIIYLSGSEPITVSDVNVPSWMAVLPSGHTIVLSGTPDAVSDGDTVAFNINNCEEVSVPFTDSIITTVGDGTLGNDVNYDLEANTSYDLTSIWREGGATIHAGGILGSMGGISPFTAPNELHDGTFQVTVHTAPAGAVPFVWIRWTGGSRKVLVDSGTGDSAEQTITVTGDVTIKFT